MNKSYKTIWNAKTNSWVVVSEATKSKGKSSGTILISALVVASVLGLSHNAQADFGAGGCSPTGNSNLEIAIGANDALGCNVQTNGQGGVIGIGAGVTAVTAAGDAIAIGTKAIASAPDGDMLAIGAGAQAIGIDSTAIGGQTVASGRDSIVIGGNGSSATATGATALGYNSNATGVRATALGSLANASGENAVAISNGSNSASNNGIAIGLGTSTAAGTSNGIAIGALSHSKAENAMALGSSAQATARDATAIGNLSSASQRNALAIGQSANAQALDSIAIGGSSDFGATRATGQYGIAIGTTAVAAQHAISMGYRSGTDTTGVGNIGIGESTAVALKGDRNIAIGEKTGNNFFGSQLIGSDNVAIGTRASAGGDSINGLGAAVAVGNRSTATDNGVAIGSQARANAGNVTATVAIGNSAIADGQGSVAIGATSVANVAGGAVGYAQTTASAENKAAIAATNSTSLGAVSVGTGADGGNRQIVNVAAGTNDSDAVNVAQLKATAETPLSFTADSGAQVDRKLGETLKISAGNATGTATTNLLTTTTADGIVISFKETPTFKGADMSGEKITNVGAGSVDAGSTDAVNGGQINTALGSVANKLGGGTTFDPATGEVTGGFAVGGTTYNSVAEAIAGSTQGLADTPLTFAGNSGSTTRKLGETLNITGGAGAALATSNSNIKTVVTADGVDIQFADAPIFAGQVKANGFDASGEKIVNVGAGTAATDAVNIGQLTTTLGGNVTYNPDGTLNTGYDVGGKTYGSVADAIAGTTNAISNTPLSFTADSGSQVDRKLGETLKISAGNATGTATTNLLTTTTADGIVISFKETPTFKGADMSGEKITNVGAGSVDAGSTDAVNGGQINTALGSVANKLGGGTTFDPATGEVTGGFAVGGTTYNSVAEAIAGSTQGLADTPLTFAGNSGSTTRKLGETLNITGGAGAALATSNSNIKTVVTADGVDIQFADAPIFAGQVKANGFDASGQKIVNVGAGTAATDAVNIGQLTTTLGGNVTYNPDGTLNTGYDVGGKTYGSVADAIAGTTNAISNTPLSFTADSGSQVDRKLGETLKISAGNATGTATTNLLTTTTADGIVISFKETPTFKGADMSGEKITNVGAGSVDAGSTDAVNGGQINTALGSVANKLGGGTTFDPATGEVTGGFAVGGTTYNSVAEAIAGSTQGLADTPLTFAGNSGSTTRKLGETLNITGGAGAALATSNSNIKTVVTADGVDIQFADAPIFAGQVKANGFDASGVNVGAGTAARSVNIGQLTTTLGGVYNPDARSILRCRQDVWQCSRRDCGHD
jgi:hypothetical protein